MNLVAVDAASTGTVQLRDGSGTSSVNPASVTGGSATGGTVTLTAAARAITSRPGR